MNAVTRVNPERLAAASTQGPLRLQVRCRSCNFTSKHQFEWISIDGTPGGKADWDTLTLPKVMVCRRCKKVDDYELTLGSQMDVVQRVLKRDPRVALGPCILWDGTVVRRASEALAKLKALADQHFDNPTAWRRLGNACGKYGESERAVSAWRKAMEVDPTEVESAAALASHLYYQSDLEASLLAVREAIVRLPAWSAPREERVSMVGEIMDILWDVLNAIEVPMAIVTWKKGEPELCHYIPFTLGTDRDVAAEGLLAADLETADIVPLERIKPGASWYPDEERAAASA
ncbi:MAG: tetratricopeptide repeat protein [Myxococcaceae bacterium]